MPSVIDGQNSLMSSLVKLLILLSVMLLEHFKTASVEHNWLNYNLSIISELIISTSYLLTFPSSLFDGFIKRHVGLEWKLSLWSLSVTKEGVLVMCSTLSRISSMVDMLFASRLIDASSLGSAFWQVFDSIIM